MIPRATIVEALPRTTRSTHAVEMSIARLREALGHPDLISTVVKRGYRLEVADA